jgi:hypothetical protein
LAQQALRFLSGQEFLGKRLKERTVDRQEQEHNSGEHFSRESSKSTPYQTEHGKHSAPNTTAYRHDANIGNHIIKTKHEPTSDLSDTSTMQLPATTPAPSTQADKQSAAQTTQFPPKDPLIKPSTPTHNHRVPWSKLVVAAFVLAAISLALAFTPAATFGVLTGLVAFLLGLAGLLAIVIRKNSRSIPAAVLSIILAIASFTIGASNTPSAPVAANPGTAVSSDIPARSASAAASASASASESAERQREAATAAAKLIDAKTTLTGKIDAARSLLDSSNNNVANPQTRIDLTHAIDDANAVNGTDPQSYVDAATPLQQTMDAVQASIQQKKQDDAAAAQQQAAEAAAAEQAKQQAEQAARQGAQQQQQQRQTPSNSAPQSTGRAHGGAFCTPQGSQAQSDRSSHILTCRVASDGRLRWKL